MASTPTNQVSTSKVSTSLAHPSRERKTERKLRLKKVKLTRQPAYRHRSSTSHLKSVQSLKDYGVQMEVLDIARIHASACTRLEAPEVKRLTDGKTAILLPDEKDRVDYVLMPSTKSAPLRSMFRSMFGEKVYPFRLSTVLTLSSSAGGIVNSTIACSTVSSGTDWSALSGVFDEFFITKFHVHWQPLSRYNGPLGSGAAPSTVATSLPMMLCSLQHNAAVYSSSASMANNYHAKWVATGDPFEYTFVNDEDPNSTVVPSSTVGGQAWSLTSNAGTYTGQVQMITGSAPPGLPVSAYLGAFATDYYVLFRCRN